MARDLGGAAAVGSAAPGAGDSAPAGAAEPDDATGSTAAQGGPVASSDTSGPGAGAAAFAPADTQDRAGASTGETAPETGEPGRATVPAPAEDVRSADDAGPPPETPPEDPEDDDSGDWGGEASWVRPFLVVAAVLGLLLLGAAGGLLIGLPGQDEPIVPTAGSVDVGFAQDMSVHHQQAVEMAGWERDHSSDPVLVQLAADIENTQNSQVGRMQGWLDLWGAAALPLGRYMTWMADAPGHDHVESGSTEPGVTRMPGMATSADLDRLRKSTGPEMDVIWLQLMLRHHEGGASMLAYAADHAQLPQVRNLAAQMLSAQAAEADYLRQLLAARGATPLPN
jgi:uncharacterized protein (DUF305 family)